MRINSRTKAGCACSMCEMGLFFWGCFVSSIFELSIPFLFFLFILPLSDDDLILEENFKEPLNSKQQTYQPFRELTPNLLNLAGFWIIF